MRILITGGAGSLGVSLIERLLPKGHDICVIDNFATGHRGALPDGLPNLVQHEGSIADQRLLDKVFADFSPTHVIHSAASYKDPDDWLEDSETNVVGTVRLVKAAEKAGVKRLLNFQTALCYGRAAETPIPVTAPVAPFTSYGVSKTAGEQYILQSKIDSISLRLANVTGPRLSIGPIPTFYQRLKEGKSCFCSDTVRDFIDAEDFLVLAEKALEDDAPVGVFNVSTGTGHSIKEIFDCVVDHLGVNLSEPVPIVAPEADDVPVVVLDPSLTERTFDWSAQIDFKTMMHRMLTWYDEHGIDAVYSHLSTPSTK